MRFWMASGPSISRAPEDDNGSVDDLDEDFSLDLPEDDLEDDEPPEDDELDDDAGETDDLDEDAEPPPRAQSRGESRQAKLARENKEIRERTERLERELAEVRGQRQRAEPTETPEQRQTRLANMEPWERTEYLRQESDQAMRAELARIRFESQDNADKVAFDALAARSPVAGKLKDDVEARLREMRATGMTAPRETILKYLIGERALGNAGRATGKARKAAAANRERQTARPAATGRGDAGAGDRRANNSTTARNKRLESYNL